SDAIAYEYCKLKENTYISIIFPHLYDEKEEFTKIINRYGCIYYDKEVNLSKLGSQNLQYDLSNTNSNDLEYKDYPFTVILFEISENEKFSQIETETYKYYRRKEPYIYFSKSHEQTIHLAQMFFNENSLSFLNNVAFRAQSDFINIITNYRRAIIE